MAASVMREDVMIRLSGRERLAVLLAVVVAALSLACGQEVAEPTSTGIPNTGTSTAAAAASPPAAKLKPRWDVHLSGDVDQLGCAGESLSSVLGE